MNFFSLSEHQQKIIAHFAWRFLQFGTGKLNVWVMSDGEWIDSVMLQTLVDMGLIICKPGNAGNYGHETFEATQEAIALGLEALVLDGVEVQRYGQFIAVTQPVAPVKQQPVTKYPVKTIKLAITPGSKISPEIKADIVGRFAVHIDQAAAGRQYTITHLESGLTVIPETKYNFRRVHAHKIAIECAEELEATLLQDAFRKTAFNSWKCATGIPDAIMRIVGRHAARR